MALEDEFPRLVGVQYATGDQWINNSRKNEGMEPKQKQYPVVDGTGDRSKVHAAAATATKSLQSCLSLCDPTL